MLKVLIFSACIAEAFIYHGWGYSFSGRRLVEHQVFKSISIPLFNAFQTAEQLPNSPWSESPVSENNICNSRTSFSENDWNEKSTFFYHFGLPYQYNITVLNGVYSERKHYAFKLHTRMKSVADSLGRKSMRDVGVDSRLFIEAALSLFAPKEGWPSGVKMIGNQVFFLF